MYISTEHPLPTTRLTQILRSNPFFSTTATTTSSARPTLEKILSIQTPDLESQDHILNYQLPVALQRHKVGLVAIDSIAANYRAEKDSGKNAAAALASRSAQLIQVGALLRKLAREHDCVIVVANQVGDRFLPPLLPAAAASATTTTTTTTTTMAVMTAKRSYPPSSSPPAYSPATEALLMSSATTAPAAPLVLSLDHQQRFFTGWGDSPDPAQPGEDNLKTPSLGLTWANQIACRVALVKAPALAGRADGGELAGKSQGGGAQGAPTKWKRWMRLVYAPWAKPTAEGNVGVEFEIWAGGVRALAD
ncbi:MAG: hypothetical protein Q9163_004673 [Psora crenata]